MGVTFAVAISHILFDLSWLLLSYHSCFFCDLCCIWRLLWFMRSTMTILRVDSGEMNPKRFQAVYQRPLIIWRTLPETVIETVYRPDSSPMKGIFADIDVPGRSITTIAGHEYTSNAVNLTNLKASLATRLVSGLLDGRVAKC